MEREIYCQETGETFYLEKLDAEFVKETKALCDICVGVDLYSEEYIQSIIGNPRQVFYLLFSKERELAGYVFFQLMDIADMMAFVKMKKSQLMPLLQREDCVISNFRSLGIAPKMRNRHFSEALTKFSIEYSRETLKADIYFGAFWKQGDKIPMMKNIEKFGFLHYASAGRIWYDEKDLYCPVCKGRCRCEAEIYYIRLQEAEK